jgi:hypothetical protein
MLIFTDLIFARDSVETILYWDFERVIVAHGDMLESGGGRERVRAAFSYLRS